MVWGWFSTSTVQPTNHILVAQLINVAAHSLLHQIQQINFDRSQFSVSFSALLLVFMNIVIKSGLSWIPYLAVIRKDWCLYDAMHTVHTCLSACLHIHVSAWDTCFFCSCLLSRTLSDYCSSPCYRECNNRSSREDCVPCAGGRACPILPLKTKLLSALTRNKSFIWFVVFLTKGSWSRKKALLSIPSATSLPLLHSTLSDAIMQVESWSHFCWQASMFIH